MGTSPTPPLSPDSARLAVLRTACRPMPLDPLAQHLALVADHQRRVYVERCGADYAWSFAHRGGPYPLLREVAAFVGVDYTRILVGGRSVGPWCVMLGPDGDEDPPTPDEWAVIDLSPGLEPEDAANRITAALG